MANTTFKPTSGLPPLLRLASYPAIEISTALQSIRNMYWPKPVTRTRTIRRKKLRETESVPDSGYASPNDIEGDEDEELQIMRVDGFERAFAVKWLTGLVARSDVWLEEDVEKRSPVIDEATALLSVFAGDDQPEQALTRVWDFPTSSGDVVHVELNDAPISPEDHTSVGLQSWAAAILLSGNMCLDPARFALGLQREKPARILELGAGTGLVSIVAKKLYPSASVLATDYHPTVLDNCQVNVETNFTSSSDDSVTVCELDWETPLSTPPFDEPFDIIFAADVIYDPLHARWIKSCVEGMLLRPNGDVPGGTLWLAMSLRIAGRHEGLHTTVEEVFASYSNGEKGALELGITEQETVGRQQLYGRADESGYTMFKIGWVA